MSDPVTNVEIEDVLSSIRRLVSNEERPRKAQDDAPAKDEEKAEPEADKLVLTPFFRVDDNEDTQQKDTQPEDAELDDTQSDDTQSAVTEAEDDAPATVDVQIDTTDDAYFGGPGAAVPWEDYEPDADGANSDDDSAEAKPADPEPAPKLREVTPPAPVDDIPENFVAEEPRQTDEETSFDAGLLGEADDILDEDALRDLVADIVRQELQGALGERITRNVRKLVRREIARALASQDLD
ncbi:MAG: hypothetical protein WAO78_16155 [Roseovarius sp.]